MKLKLFDKIMMVTLLILGFLALIALAFACIFPAFLLNLARTIVVIANSVFFRISLLLIVALLLFLLVRIFFVRKRDDDPSKAIIGDKTQKANNTRTNISSTHVESTPKPPKSSVDIKISSDAGGSSFISSNLIRQIVDADAKNVQGVNACSSEVSQSEGGGVDIKLDVSAGVDVLLPKLNDDLQSRIRASVEEKTGIKVLNLEVNFSSLETISSNDQAYTTLN